MITQAHYKTLKDQNGLTGRCCFNPHNCVLCKTFRQILRYNKFAPVQTPISWRFCFSCSSLECRRSTSSRCRSSWKASHHGSMCIWTHTHTHTHRYMSNMTETQSLHDYNTLDCTYRLERAWSNIIRNVMSPVCVRSWPLQVISSHTLPVADMQREPATF